MTIAERIRLYRQQKGFSQAELADRAQVNNKSLSRYELGSSKPPGDVLKNIVVALEVSTDSLSNNKIINIKDKELIQKLEMIQEIADEDKTIISRFLDLTIRNFKTRKAYCM